MYEILAHQDQINICGNSYIKNLGWQPQAYCERGDPMMNNYFKLSPLMRELQLNKVVFKTTDRTRARSVFVTLRDKAMFVRSIGEDDASDPQYKFTTLTRYNAGNQS